MKNIRSFVCLFVLILLFVSFLTPYTISQAEEMEHLFLIDKDKGGCTQLVGNVQMTVVYVDVTGDGLEDEATENMKKLLASSADRLVTEARSYGKELSFDFDYYYTSTEEECLVEDPDTWASAVLQTLDGVPFISDDYWANRPLMLCVNSDGRSFACTKMDVIQPEYMVVFEESATVEGNMHELLHLYGAQDFYLFDEAQEAANSYLPGSIMGSEQSEVIIDDLTAYVVGWTDEPTEMAQQFLDATDHLTQEDMHNALNQTWQSGWVVIEGETSTYYGMLQDGAYHDFGKIEWNIGDSYQGQWDWGYRSGKGAYRWADGTLYIGDFLDNEMTGQGTMYWPDGSGYTGEFVDMQFHGEGTRFWADGSVYTGDFVFGEQTGEGMIVYGDGASYYGEFLGGKYHGYGVLIENNGSIHQGEFYEGVKHGYGQLMYEDGRVVEGTFENNVLMYWEDGTPVVYSDD